MAGGDSLIGTAPRLAKERIRLKQEPTMAFAASSVAQISNNAGLIEVSIR